MSVCWASNAARLGLAALLSVALGAAPAAAKLYVGTHAGGAHHIVERVSITKHGIEVRTNGVDSSTGFVIADSIGHGRVIIDEGAGMVRLFSDATVKAGDHVDGDVVAVFGSVHVAGSVSGSAIAVFGTVDFSPGATVGGDAVAVGGGVQDTDGAHIGGQTVSVGMLPLTLGLPALPVTIAFIALGWLVTVFFGWVLVALFPERLARVAVTSSRRTAASLILGLVSGPLVPVAAVLLMVTVIGLPIGLMLPIVYIAMVYAGQLAALHVLGSKLVRRPLANTRSVAPILAGSVLVALSCTGTGAFLLSRFGSRPLDIAAAPMPGTIPVPPAPPVAGEGPAPVQG